MNCPEIRIDEITPELYGRLLTEASSSGAKFDGTKASIQGLEFNWTYDAVSLTLHITCIKKPFWASCEVVEMKIRELVRKSSEAI